MERIPKPGEFYRHIENKLYQIVVVAEHAETGEKEVVYQALYGSYRVFALSLTVFNRRVDKGQYPQAQQEYVFEPVKFLAEKRTAHKNSWRESAKKDSLEDEAFLESEEFSGNEEFLDGESEFEELMVEDLFDELLDEDYHGGEKSEEDYYGRENLEDYHGREKSEEDYGGRENLEEDYDAREKSDEIYHDRKNDDGETRNEATQWLEDFLDAEGYEKQLEVLAKMRGKVGKRELGSICLVLGIPVLDGDEDSQIANIKKHLETRMHYDTRRLR